VAAVLLVDDESNLRHVFRRALLRAGFDVYEAPDGEAALALMQQVVPDVVVTDLAMPRLSGVGLAQAMEADPALAHVPVVFMTGHGDSRIPFDSPILEKPFRLEALIAAVQDVLA
jgi:CheY-like chemotaxis protein